MVFRRHRRRLGRRASRRRGPRAARLEGSCQPRRPLRLRCARMIVDDPPYELIVLFADEDARRLVMGLIERGQERRCLRPFRWRAIRDPRRDAVVKAPDAALRPFVGRAEHRFVVLWDHSGCGRDAEPSEAVEKDVEAIAGPGGRPGRSRRGHRLHAGARGRPGPSVSTRVVEVLSERRGVQCPPDAQWLAALGPEPLSEQLASKPKEVFDTLLRFLNLRHSAEVFEWLAMKTSIPVLKSGHAIGRISDALQQLVLPRPVLWSRFGRPSSGAFEATDRVLRDGGRRERRRTQRAVKSLRDGAQMVRREEPRASPASSRRRAERQPIDIGYVPV